MAYNVSDLINDYMKREDPPSAGAPNRWDNMRIRTKAQYAPQQREWGGPWEQLREMQANSGGFSSQYNPQTMDPRQDPRLHLNLSASTQPWDAPNPNRPPVPAAGAYEDPDSTMNIARRQSYAPAAELLMSMQSPTAGPQVAPMPTKLQRMETPRDSYGTVMREGMNSVGRNYGNQVQGMLGLGNGWGARPESKPVTWTDILNTLLGGSGGYAFKQPRYGL